MIMNKRVYKRITPRLVAEHATQELLSGNNTAALEAIEPDDGRSYGATRMRASRIVAKRDNVTAAQYIENSLEQIAGDAMAAISEGLLSSDARIATKNAHYVIDHIRGKAVQRSISVTTKLNIQSVLD